MGSKLEDRAFLAFLVIVSILFFVILKPFFGAIFWAALLALLFFPLQRRLLRRFPKRLNLVSLLTLILILLIVVIPLLLLVAGLAQEGAKLYQKLQSGEIQLQGFFDRFWTSVPAMERLLARLGMDWTQVREQLSQGAMAGSQFLATQAFNIGQGTIRFSLSLVLMIYLLFFFLRDGERLVEWVIRAVPLGDRRERLLFARFADMAHATIKGNLIVAIVQGSLGGLLFWVLGLEGALLWGVVMTVLSLLPVVGSFMVWGPVGIYFLLTGDLVRGLIMLAFGALVISVVDNILRPILVARDTQMPDYLVLLSTLGGIALYGINGFVIGPAIATLFLAFWQIFMREFNHGVPPGTSL